VRTRESLSSAQQIDGIQLYPLRDLLHGSQLEVALPSLDLSHSRAMEANHVGERFLAQPASLPTGSEVLADGALQIAFHPGKASCLLLYRLQTYK
jgi:hypothetical protein